MPLSSTDISACLYRLTSSDAATKKKKAWLKFFAAVDLWRVPKIEVSQSRALERDDIVLICVGSSNTPSMKRWSALYVVAQRHAGCLCVAFGMTLLLIGPCKMGNSTRQSGREVLAKRTRHVEKNTSVLSFEVSQAWSCLVGRPSAWPDSKRAFDFKK